MTKITLSDPEAANRALAKLQELSTRTDDGTWHITISPFERMASELLANSLKLQPPIPERTLRALAFRSVFKWLRFAKYRENPDRARGFIGAVEREFRRLERKKAAFHVLMFMNCSAEDIIPFGQPSVMGTDLEIKDWDELEDLNTDALWNLVKVHDLAPPLLHDFDLDHPVPRTADFTPIVVSTRTFDADSAVEISQTAFDLFRACINLPAVVGRTIYLRSTAKALSPSLPTPIYGVFRARRQFVTVYVTNEKFEYKRAKISPQHAKAAVTFLDRLNEAATKDISELYTRCLRLYQDAIDIASPRQSYLALWHVLEAIADPTTRLAPQRDIEARIATLIRPDPMVKDLLHVLVERRNDLVHAGDFPQEADPLYFSLKLITDMALGRFLKLARRFDTPQQIDDYLTLDPQGDTVLRRKKEVIEDILGSRNR
jgi:hypothetical protein